MSVAWHTAAFHRSKKMPKHDTIIEKPRRGLPAQELQAKVAGWLANRKK